MDAYIYRASMYCEHCAQMIAIQNKPVKHYGDSDCYPQGPFPQGGGEADRPQHCDRCYIFLENPLTHDGESYVCAAIDNSRGDPKILMEWREFYSYLWA